ncbi:MAG: TIGR04282 family arsenosugar biosynthesis glycosyltransferase [Verrucomicrobia bacterium]|nr:TIGR04282 family arsenosugar biosynthesis glycosyltransferase [Verrucomicrobiota bacterium]
MHNHAVVVFLKNPVSGTVKTRLAADIGNDEAVRIYRKLVAATLENLPWQEARIIIAFSPCSEEQAIRAWLAPFVPPGATIAFLAQVDGDLGQRMAAAVAESVDLGHSSITLVGTDCPELSLPHYHAAWDKLIDHDAVFGPAWDGGYYLLALKGMTPYLFEGIPWSASNTLDESLTAAGRKHLRTALLEPLRDIDTIADLTDTHIMDDSLILLAPIYQERVWGGRTLETLYGRTLPEPETPYGESWEVVDREEAQSIVTNGPFAGKSLNDLWQKHREEAFGPTAVAWECDQFPILVKILDARDKLSIQVHPPADIAPSLHDEPKTEMWYIVDADPDAKLYVGLKEGVTRDAFERGLDQGATASQVHALSPKAGEFIFIPSGRLHAIGAGLLIFEIQQNSDTTYRVFDWNRMGLDGNPRQLHIEESMKCIDFADVAPTMTPAQGELLVDCEYFNVQIKTIPQGGSGTIASNGEFAIAAVAAGSIEVDGRIFSNGDFFLIPACADGCRSVTSAPGADVLITRLP